MNTLLLAHCTELLKQWQERLPSFLNVSDGMIGLAGVGQETGPPQIDIAVMPA